MTLRISVRLERWRRRFAQQDSIALIRRPTWRAMLGIIVRQAHFRKPNVRWGRTAAIPRRRRRAVQAIIVLLEQSLLHFVLWDMRARRRLFPLRVIMLQPLKCRIHPHHIKMLLQQCPPLLLGGQHSTSGL